MGSKNIVLVVLIVASAIAVVAVRHQNRLVFVELQNYEKGREEYQLQWGRLMIEKATWTRQHNVADDAENTLEMTVPAPEKIITLELDQRAR